MMTAAEYLRERGYETHEGPVWARHIDGAVVCVLTVPGSDDFSVRGRVSDNVELHCPVVHAADLPARLSALEAAILAARDALLQENA